MFIWLFAGDGPMLAQMQQLASDLGIKKSGAFSRKPPRRSDFNASFCGDAAGFGTGGIA
jgi:hypothetical protein